MVKLCYIDESGDLGPIPLINNVSENYQPVLIIGGIFIDSDVLPDLTHDFIGLKHRFYPGLNYPTDKFLDRIIPEIKGADLRRNAMRGSHKIKRHAIGFLDKIIDLFFTYHIKLVSRIWIKIPGEYFDGKAVYTSSIQSIFTYFDHFSYSNNDKGVCIADSRDYLKNINVSHSVFTQKFRIMHPLYKNIIEMPCFGHSNNSSGLQLCDILCSAFLFPIASYVYCSDFIDNVHVNSAALSLRDRYGSKLRDLQYRFINQKGLNSGGIVVSDPFNKKNAISIFKQV
ncbi:MAG: DUF3800 domain-containing protein [Alphaproteobacteria bacterium]|nr:DUF3800 domain-containing protein [Alphaproteobacteria bacterium]